MKTGFTVFDSRGSSILYFFIRVLRKMKDVSEPVSKFFFKA